MPNYFWTYYRLELRFAHYVAKYFRDLLYRPRTLKVRRTWLTNTGTDFEWWDGESRARVYFEPLFFAHIKPVIRDLRTTVAQKGLWPINSHSGYQLALEDQNYILLQKLEVDGRRAHNYVRNLYQLLEDYRVYFCSLIEKRINVMYLNPLEALIDVLMKFNLQKLNLASFYFTVKLDWLELAYFDEDFYFFNEPEEGEEVCVLKENVTKMNLFYMRTPKYSPISRFSVRQIYYYLQDSVFFSTRRRTEQFFCKYFFYINNQLALLKRIAALKRLKHLYFSLERCVSNNVVFQRVFREFYQLSSTGVQEAGGSQHFEDFIQFKHMAHFFDAQKVINSVFIKRPLGELQQRAGLFRFHVPRMLFRQTFLWCSGVFTKFLRHFIKGSTGCFWGRSAGSLRSLQVPLLRRLRNIFLTSPLMYSSGSLFGGNQRNQISFSWNDSLLEAHRTKWDTKKFFSRPHLRYKFLMLYPSTFYYFKQYFVLNFQCIKTDYLNRNMSFWVKDFLTLEARTSSLRGEVGKSKFFRTPTASMLNFGGLFEYTPRIQLDLFYNKMAYRRSSIYFGRLLDIQYPVQFKFGTHGMETYSYGGAFTHFNCVYWFYLDWVIVHALYQNIFHHLAYFSYVTSKFRFILIYCIFHALLYKSYTYLSELMKYFFENFTNHRFYLQLLAYYFYFVVAAAGFVRGYYIYSTGTIGRHGRTTYFRAQYGDIYPTKFSHPDTTHMYIDSVTKFGVVGLKIWVTYAGHAWREGVTTRQRLKTNIETFDKFPKNRRVNYREFY